MIRKDYPVIEKPTQVELEDLANYPLMTITSCGSENLYFTHENKKYFCKCL